ncbi:MAG: (4Fe-4S)-binding protein [Actinomycetota bacterium]
MTDDPTAAGVPRTTAPDRVYEADGIAVEWRASRCIHTANCLRSLPSVFDTSARPWIDVSGATPEQIAEAVRTCPTGALRYEGEGLPPDDGGTEVAIDAQPDGPLYVRGPVTVTDHEDRPLTAEPRLALCRCGASENKPYCDNSHKHVGWTEGGG